MHIVIRIIYTYTYRPMYDPSKYLAEINVFIFTVCLEINKSQNKLDKR